MQRFGFAKWMVVLAVTWACGSASAGAAPIIWQYTGAVTFSQDPSSIPLGTPATFRVTILDPTDNIVAGLPGVPAWAGAYWTNIALDVAGLHYESTNAALEINYDPIVGVDQRGSVMLRQFTWSGPSLFGQSMGPLLCLPSGCLEHAQFGGADPDSPDVPSTPLATFTLPLRASPSAAVLVRVVGSNPQVIPEPAIGLLLGGGALAALWRRH